MIPEYNMRSAMPVDGSEPVGGYLLKYGNRLSIQDYSRTNGEIFAVQESTIQPVRVKPIIEFENVDLSNNQMGTRIVKRVSKCECPNCQAYVHDQYLHCPDCGMALL